MGRSKWFTRLQGWGTKPTRWQRRLLMAVALVSPVVYCLTAIISLYPWRDYGGRLYGMAAAIYSLMAIGMGMFLLRLALRSFSAVSLEEYARLAYGAAFEQLTVMQKDRVRWQYRQAWKEKNSHMDERDAAMQRDAEGRAFRMLRRGLPVLVVVCWGVCLSLPIGPVRLGLLFGAVAISGLVFVVLALPVVIRVWMMLEEVAEPRVVTMEREA